MDFKTQMSVAIQAESRRKGATAATCAGLYAVAIGAASADGSEYWQPINAALETSFGAKGRDRVKVTAWAIHDAAAAALTA